VQEGSFLFGSYPDSRRARRPCDAFVPGDLASLPSCKS
jgi:hypothetical protein